MEIMKNCLTKYQKNGINIKVTYVAPWSSG